MLKAAIEKIEAMTAPTIIDRGEHTYLAMPDGKYNELRETLDLPLKKQLQSLDGLVKMVQQEALKRHDKVFVNIPDHLTAEAFLPVNEDWYMKRVTLYSAAATDVPGWEAETKMPFERAAVALQTRFQKSDDREYTMQLLSQITTGAKVTYNDTGVATTIVTQKGVSLQQNATIRPIVRLKPYRTFQEIDQPEGLFLIRIDERGISFIEADGGMWKLTARQTIKAYLDEALKSEIDAGQVVVML